MLQLRKAHGQAPAFFNQVSDTDNRTTQRCMDHLDLAETRLEELDPSGFPINCF
jgi:hypothetical protein